MTESIPIGEVARRTGVATSALRYYEELGLIAPCERVSGHRRFDERVVDEVGVVLFLRDVGFSLAEIGALIESRAVSPTEWRRLAEEKVVELDRQIADATAARTAIEHALQCPRDDILGCPNFWSVVGRRLEGRAVAAMTH